MVFNKVSTETERRERDWVGREGDGEWDDVGDDVEYWIIEIEECNEDLVIKVWIQFVM